MNPQSFLTFQVDAPILAVITTVHLSALLLLAHQRPDGLRDHLLLLPSLGFAATPWLLPNPLGVTTGLALHIGWLIVCRRWLPVPSAQAAPVDRPLPSMPKTDPQPASAPKASPAPTGFTQVPVIGVFPETDDITTFRMARPEGFSFNAGQFTSVRVNIDGEPVIRCYTISSAPEAAGYFEISVKRQGLMSGTLHASMRPGSMISVMPPAGGFSYPSGDDRPIALLAGGVGITPMMSMLRHAVQVDPTRPITLLYSVHTHRDIAFREELGLISKRHPHGKIVLTTTRGPHDTSCLSGRIDAGMISDHVRDLANTVFMICGPGPMIEGMKTTLAGLGVPDSQIRSEAFEAAIASTAAPSLSAEDESPAASPPCTEFQLHLVESDATIPVNSADTLLTACEAAGIEIPSACRAGVCGTCRCRLVKGDVRCDSDLLDDGERAEGFILPCVSWAESDCAMEAG